MVVAVSLPAPVYDLAVAQVGIAVASAVVGIVIDCDRVVKCRVVIGILGLVFVIAVHNVLNVVFVVVIVIALAIVVAIVTAEFSKREFY